jgi:AcrR family transcriptional regulator
MEKALRSDARRNLEAILQAAAEAFAERGLEVGVADIARRAGVGTATIFRRFPTKEDLIAAVFMRRMEEVVEVAERCAELPGGIAAVREFFERATELQVRDRGFLENIDKGRFAGDPRLEALIERGYRAIERIVANAQAAGELRADVKPADVPVLLHSVCSGAALLSAGEPGMWRRYMELVIDGLRPGHAGLTCPAPTFDAIAGAR